VRIEITSVRKPILALAELAWNAFDADAARVGIILEADALGGLNAIEITGDGWIGAILTLTEDLHQESVNKAKLGLKADWGRSALPIRPG